MIAKDIHSPIIKFLGIFVQLLSSYNIAVFLTFIKLQEKRPVYLFALINYYLEK
jgi:hypothetical protein